MSAPAFFRKAALEKLSTPEKLDQLIKITSLNAWIVLIMIASTITTAISWSFYGRVKTKIDTMGIILGGEVYDVVSTSQGQLLNLNVDIGDHVNAGDVIATIEQPDLILQIESAKAAVSERQYELKQLEVYGSQDSRLQGDIIDKQRKNIKLQIQATQKSLSFHQQQLSIEKDLLSKGLITKPQVINREMQIEETLNQIKNLEANLVQTNSQELNSEYSHSQRRTLIQQRIAQEKLRLDQMIETYEKRNSITSPHTGEVLEILSKSGVVVGPGTPLFKIKNSKSLDDKLKGVMYIPSRDGKKIKVGMDALVVPSTVRPQEFGYIKGKITYVSEFPVTQQGLMTSMQNDQLVRSMLQMGAPFEVYVEFEENAENFSGYQWTSASGPKVNVNPGTSCSGKITVKEEAPITLVVPALKKFFNLY